MDTLSFLSFSAEYRAQDFLADAQEAGFTVESTGKWGDRYEVAVAADECHNPGLTAIANRYEGRWVD